MTSNDPSGRRGRRLLSAAAFLIGIASIPAMADDVCPAAGGPRPKGVRARSGKHGRGCTCSGTLGYGPPGLHPGVQGFGLGYHPGYGYGGDALGVGAEGGYPFYGGPGYPHPAPCLKRVGGIAPFAFYGGSGGPSPAHPNEFGTVGPLVGDSPVVTIEGDPLSSGALGDYGAFSGTLPYPETAFAPFTSPDSSAGSPGAPNPPSPPPPPNPIPASFEVSTMPAPVPAIGIETATASDVGGARGLRVLRVRADGLLSKSGLVVGDVILSVDGRVTERPDDLASIVSRAVRGNSLSIEVRSGRDGLVRRVLTRIR